MAGSGSAVAVLSDLSTRQSHQTHDKQLSLEPICRCEERMVQTYNVVLCGGGNYYILVVFDWGAVDGLQCGAGVACVNPGDRRPSSRAALQLCSPSSPLLRPNGSPLLSRYSPLSHPLLPSIVCLAAIFAVFKNKRFGMNSL